jgi:hypothetical protein
MGTGRNAGSEGRGTKDTRENGLEVLARAARLKGLADFLGHDQNCPWSPLPTAGVKPGRTNTMNVYRREFANTLDGLLSPRGESAHAQASSPLALAAHPGLGPSSPHPTKHTPTCGDAKASVFTALMPRLPILKPSSCSRGWSAGVSEAPA